MRLTDIAEGALSGMIARYVKRAILFALIGACAIVTLYYVNAAASLALALQYGPLYAYLIMAGIYAVAALIALAVFYAMRHRAVERQAAADATVASLLAAPRDMKIAMLIEAAMLGYAMSRKPSGKSII